MHAWARSCRHWVAPCFPRLQFSEIINETRLGAHKDVDLDAQFDHCFWVGDLNYR